MLLLIAIKFVIKIILFSVRLELQELSLSSDGTLSPIQSSPVWDYQAIFDQSEHSHESDIPISREVNDFTKQNEKYTPLFKHTINEHILLIILC